MKTFFLSLKAGSEVYDSVNQYTKYWTNQIDRGGLYCVSDQFFDMMKDIETVCRRYLDVRIQNVYKKIKDHQEVGLWYTVQQ